MTGEVLDPREKSAIATSLGKLLAASLVLDLPHRDSCSFRHHPSSGCYCWNEILWPKKLGESLFGLQFSWKVNWPVPHWDAWSAADGWAWRLQHVPIGRNAANVFPASMGQETFHCLLLEVSCVLLQDAEDLLAKITLSMLTEINENASKHRTHLRTNIRQKTKLAFPSIHSSHLNALASLLTS